MPTLAAIRAAIKTKLSSVTDVGVVHDYERYATREAEFRSLYEWPSPGGGQIRGWNFRRLSTRETSPAIGRYVVDHGWVIRGYLSLDDSAATEKTFDDLVEAIRDAFRADETLGGVVAATVVDGDAGAQVPDSGPVIFAGVLCHSARLQLTTRHYL